jgi:type I restriction enzyme S subunit
MTPEPLTEKHNQADALSLPAGFKMTELGPLPEEWQVVRLGEAFDIMQGKSLSAKKNKGFRPRPFLRTSNVYWGYLDLSNIDMMDFTEEEEQKYTLKYGDLLVCEGGEVGRTAMWEEQGQGIYFQNHIHRLRAKRTDIYPRFVMYWLETAFTLLYLYSGTSNKTTIPNLSRGRLGTFPIPLPPLPEQRAIAHVLRTVQGAKEAAARVIQAARDLKQSLMRHLFTYGPVPLDQVHCIPLQDTELGPLPAHWQVVRLGEVAETTTGGTPRRDTPSFFGGSIPWVKSSELRDSWITNTEETITEAGLENSNARLLPSNTLLIAMYGATAGKVGILRIPATTNQAICAVLPDQTLASNEYLFYVLIFSRKKLLDQRFGGAQPNLNQTTIRSFPIPLPPLPEQQAIARILQAVDRKIAAEQARLQALEALFKTLLHHLMTGQVRVVPPTTEAAA